MRGIRRPATFTINFGYGAAINDGMPYTIYIDGVAVATVRGPMAALISEATCRMLEVPNDIHVDDVLKRHHKE